MNKIYILLMMALLGQCRTAEKAFTPLTPEQNQAWVDQKLDSVMLARTYQASNGMDMPYRIFIPEGMRRDEQLPLLIHLHGRGERGTDNTTRIYDNIPLFNGERSIVSPNMQHKYRCVVLVP